MAECEIRFIKSFCYSEISPRQDFLTTGPAHQCWNALLLSLSFFARCMRPPFSEVFRRKLSGKSARRVSRGCAVNRTTAGALHFSIQRSVEQAPSCFRQLLPQVRTLHLCPGAGTANTHRAREHFPVSVQCPPGRVVWWLFNQSCIC